VLSDGSGKWSRLWSGPVFRLGLAGLCGAVLLANPGPSGAEVTGTPDLARWTAVWATSLQAMPQQPDLMRGADAPDVAGKTVRQIIFPSLGGSEARLQVSNRYGTTQLQVVQASFAKAAEKGAALGAPAIPVTFGGKAELVLPPGGEVESDPIKVNLVGHQPYAVSLYLGPQQRLQAWHLFARQENFISAAGDHSRDATADAYQQRFTQFTWITSLSVAEAPVADAHASSATITSSVTASSVTGSSAVPGAVLAIGDSITDGVSSSLGLNHRWPDVLSSRLAVEAKLPLAVLNAGIAGNRLLSDSPCFGESLSARFEREITDHAGVQTAVVLIGINDINFAAMPPQRATDCGFPNRQVTAENLIAGYRALAEVAHRHHVRLLIGTLTPASLPAAREDMRQAVNRWIRGGEGVDGVIDFDAALRDQAHPQVLRADYDSGDHLHPSDAGFAAMAAAVPLNLLSAPAETQLKISQASAPISVQ
jgi:lysophospholipase L1-like esterase